MKKPRKKNVVFWAILINPFVLAVYGVFCFYLYSLCQYGGVKRRVPIILACALLLLLWIAWCFYLKSKQKKAGQEESHTDKKIAISRIWVFIALFLLAGTTLVTGARIYQSGVQYNGKLSWFIQDLKNKRQITFTHNNIYQDHLEGIFDDVRGKITMPEELYLSSTFSLRFKKDGSIVSFNTYLYGKNEKGETESFLMAYDENKSDKITVYLNGYVHEEYDEHQRLQPLMDMLQWIPLEETVSPWDQEEYGILYSGVRDWGYNTEGINYIDGERNIRQEEFPREKIVGYTVSVYVPGKVDIITPARFIHDEIKVSPEESGSETQSNWEIGYHYNDGEETFFLNENLGYQLSITDAALGSRFYALLQTQNGGAAWKTINEDPYLGNTGVSAGITFINEDLGFIGLSHSGGSYGELYRTEDGGISYQEVSLPDIEVSLTDTETYVPFDFPEMPYEEDGKLLLLVGQGQDGDYKGGIKALYQSEDAGVTWEYIREWKSSS